MDRILGRKIAALVLGSLATILLLEAGLAILAWTRRAASPAIEPGAFVVLCVGNSITRGDGVAPGHSYPAQLERILRERHPSLNVRVVNAGKSNANTALLLEALPGELEASRPKIVTIMAGDPNFWNRYGADAFLKRKDTDRLERALEWASRWSRVAGFLLLRKRPPGGQEAPTRPASPLTWLSYIANHYPNLNNNEVSLAIRDLEEHARSHAHAGVAQALVNLHLWRGEVDSAEKWFRRAVELDPGFFHFDAFRMSKALLANHALQLTSEKRERLAAFQKLLKLNFPEDRVIKFLFEATGRYFPGKEGARRSCRLGKEALKHQPYSQVRLQNLAYCLVENGKEREAVDEISAAIERDPHSVLNPSTIIRTMERLVKDGAQRARLREIDKTLLARYVERGSSFAELSNQEVLAWIEHDLRQMHFLAGQAGAKVVIQTYSPRRDNANRLANEALRAHAARTGAPLSDLNRAMQPLFANEGEKETYYTDAFGPLDEHLSAKGNALAAETLYKTLHDQGLIPELESAN